MNDLKVNLSATKGRGPLHILVDSTGLRVYGEGEWKVRKHGYSKRRTWRKLHLSVHPGTEVNEATQEIEIAVLTEVGKDDAGTGGQMLQDIPDPVEVSAAMAHMTSANSTKPAPPVRLPMSLFRPAAMP